MIGYSINQFYKDIKWISYSVEVYASEVKSENLKWDPDVIIAIARGGCVPGVYLSHLLNKSLEIITWQTRDGSVQELPNITKGKQALIVDDINDSGLTLDQLLDGLCDKTEHAREKLRKNVKTATLWERSSSTVKVDVCPNKINTNDWIVFPWEVPPSEPHS